MVVVGSSRAALERGTVSVTSPLATCVCQHEQAVRSYGQQAGVPFLRWLVTGLSPRRPGFSSRVVSIGSGADRVAMAERFPRVLWFYSIAKYAILFHILL